MRYIWLLLGCNSLIIHSAERNVGSCTSCSPVLFDNFSQKYRNSIGGYCTDDNTMAVYRIENSTMILQKKQGVSSYYFSKIACMKDVSAHQGIEFDMTIPNGATLAVSIRVYKPGQPCGTGSTDSYYKSLKAMGIVSVGSKMTVRVPFSDFPVFDGSRIHAIDFGSFSVDSAAFAFSNIRFYCDADQCGDPTSSLLVPTATNTVTTLSQSSLPSTGLTSTRISAWTTALVTTPAPSSGTAAPSTTTSSTPNASNSCLADLIIDDFLHPSRYSLLHYNSLEPPGATSDDNSMNSIAVGNLSLKMNPKSSSYFFSQFKCQQFDLSQYEGLYFEYYGPSTGSFSVGFQYYDTDCYSGAWKAIYVRTSTYLDRNMIKIPFDSVQGFNKLKPHGIIFSAFDKLGLDYLLGPLRLYCAGSNFAQVPIPTESSPPPSPTAVPTYSTGSQPDLTIIDFQSTKALNRNDLGFYQGRSDMGYSLSGEDAIMTPTSQLAVFYTTISNTCGSLTAYQDSYLEVNLTELPTGQDFDVLLFQHNAECDESKRFPVNWGQAQVSWYLNSERNRAIIPIAVLSAGINLGKISSVAFKYFRTFASIKVNSIRIIREAPNGWILPPIYPQAPLHFDCKIPGDIALGIDNGLPRLTQQVLQILKDENIKATFFVLGTPLKDSSNNFTLAYLDAMTNGHTIGHHSNSHPYFNTLANWQVDEEIDVASDTIFKQFRVSSTLFRPPFGNIGKYYLIQMLELALSWLNGV